VDEGPGRCAAVAAGRDLSEPAPEREGRVAPPCDLAHEGRRRPAEPGPEPERGRFGERALPLERRRDGRAEAYGEAGEGRAGAGSAEAEVEEGAAGAAEEGGGGLGVGEVGRGRRGGVRRVRAGVDVVPEEVELGRDLDEDRAGRTRARDPARVPD